jgi:hypothetical protein
MSQQFTAKVNKSLDDKLNLLGQTAEDMVRDRLISMAQDAVTLSPVDTGAYVTSFSYKTNSSSRGRSKSSKNKPRGQNPEAKRREGLDNLVTDLNAIDLSETKSITLRNDSPHAEAVEHGEFWPRQGGYFVFTQLRNRYG